MGRLKLAAMRRTVRVDAKSMCVDDHVVVIPTKQCEVVRAGRPTPVMRRDVVWLESVPALASRGRADTVVSPEDESPQARGDRMDGRAGLEGLAVLEDRDPDPPGAEQFLEDARSDPDPV